MSETAKHRAQVVQYAWGNGCDIGSACDPLVAWDIQIELSEESYRGYNAIRKQERVHWHDDAAVMNLPFKDGVLQHLHSSHLLEDFAEWGPVLKEWDRVIKAGGYLIVSVPDRERFRSYVQRGKDAGYDCDNMAHKRESFVGDLTEHIVHLGYTVVMDRFVTNNPLEYSIIGVFRKNS